MASEIAWSGIKGNKNIMAMVQPKSQKLRLLTTHLLLLVFIAAIMFPLLMVIAISLREGNFATGSLILTKSPGSTGGWRWASASNTLTAASPRHLSRFCYGCGTR